MLDPVDAVRHNAAERYFGHLLPRVHGLGHGVGARQAAQPRLRRRVPLRHGRHGRPRLSCRGLPVLDTRGPLSTR